MAGLPTLMPPGGDLIRHHPEVMREEQAKADAIIDYARKVKDWELLERAVDLKIEQQGEFVVWWEAMVRPPGHGNNAERSYFSRIDAERLTGIFQQQVSRWRKRLRDRERYRDRMIQAARRAAELRAAANHRAEGTGENEWFTPSEYVEAARLVLGEIDLDPATHETAQKWIKAKQYFTRADDGLKHEWHGRVWLNPPYARGEIGAFVTKLIKEIEAQRVTDAVLLTHSYTDTEWFHNVSSVMQALCFTKGRVKFVDDAGDACAPTQGQVFFYYGPYIEEFDQVFGTFGLITYPWRPMQ